MISNMIAYAYSGNPYKKLAYNANDLVRSATLNKEDLTATTQFTYDGNGNLTSVTDPLGRVTQFTYDGFDRIRSVKDPLNNSTVIVG